MNRKSYIRQFEYETGIMNIYDSSGKTFNKYIDWLENRLNKAEKVIDEMSKVITHFRDNYKPKKP